MSQLKDSVSTINRNLPPYLVPDFSALLETLHLVKQLVQSSKFIVIIPLCGMWSTCIASRSWMISACFASHITRWWYFTFIPIYCNYMQFSIINYFIWHTNLFIRLAAMIWYSMKFQVLSCNYTAMIGDLCLSVPTRKLDRYEWWLFMTKLILISST